MAEVEDGVERPASPFVFVVLLFVVDCAGGCLGEEVDEPVDEDGAPDEPDSYILSEMCLELN